MKCWIYILSIALVFSSCKKVKNSSSEIAFGDVEKMRVFEYDTILSFSYGEYQFIELDINEDKENDLRFSSTYSGTNGTGYYSNFYVSVLSSDLLLNGFYLTDTIYYSRDTTVSGSPGSYITLYNENYSCEYTGNNDVIDVVRNNYFHVKDNRKGDLMSTKNQFSSTGYNLTQRKNINPDVISYNPDSLIIRSFNYLVNCYKFENGTENYIGFKLKKRKSFKLGWVKFSLTGNGLHIMEYAIEK